MQRMLDHYDRFSGQTAYLYGKGPSLDAWLANKPEQEQGLRICINDTYLHVENPQYVISHNQNTWLEKIVQNHRPGITYLCPRQLEVLVQHAGFPMANIVLYYKAEKNNLWLTSLNEFDAATRSTLYSNIATATSALHFAKILGCYKVRLIGFGGSGYSKEFKEQTVDEEKYQHFLYSICELLAYWGMEAWIYQVDGEWAELIRVQPDRNEALEQAIEGGVG